MKDWYPPRSHHQLGRADAMGQADLTRVSQNHTQNPGGPALPTSPWEQHSAIRLEKRKGTKKQKLSASLEAFLICWQLQPLPTSSSRTQLLSQCVYF